MYNLKWADVKVGWVVKYTYRPEKLWGISEIIAINDNIIHLKDIVLQTPKDFGYSWELDLNNIDNIILIEHLFSVEPSDTRDKVKFIHPELFI